MDTRAKLLEFLKSQRFLVVGTQGDEPWIVNVFHGIDDDFNIYFVSGEDAEHSQHILKNPTVTFSTVWYNDADHTDRKGVQGRGMCEPVDDEQAIELGMRLHNEKFPEFKEDLTPEYIKSSDNNSRVWRITPSIIKFWNDELYGENGSEPFRF